MINANLIIPDKIDPSAKHQGDFEDLMEYSANLSRRVEEPKDASPKSSSERTGVCGSDDSD